MKDVTYFVSRMNMDTWHIADVNTSISVLGYLLCLLQYEKRCFLFRDRKRHLGKKYVERYLRSLHKKNHFKTLDDFLFYASLDVFEK